MNYSKVIKHFARLYMIWFWNFVVDVHLQKHNKMKIKEKENQVEWIIQVADNELQHFQHFLVVRYYHDAIVNIRQWPKC